MATYVTKKCPHCNYAYQINKSGDQRTYGSPFMTCVCCNKVYWDTDIKEPALHGYSNSYETSQSIKRWIVVLMTVPMALILIAGGVLVLSEGGIAEGLFALAFGGALAWIVFSYYKSNFDNKDYTLLEHQRNYDESMERLKDTEYLTALAKIDPLAKKVLQERTNGQTEHYATRPE